ncbi:MAG TPA: acetoacetate--CoA ligase [Candidatus Micrarchaeia archaeon]|nr:acetoacetate--CoA ligase [Candidatus Micrarchaeia archaeon]
MPTTTTERGPDPAVLWEPPELLRRDCGIAQYLSWLGSARDLHFPDYEACWRWSVTDLDRFWRSIWDRFAVDADAQPTAVRVGDRMPDVRWFPGATLNYAHHALRHGRSDRPAVVHVSELRGPAEVSWAELEREVAALAAWLREQGVSPGDRVAAYLPNIPEAVIAFLAAASVGAVWSSCSPDFGVRSVVDRFRQIEPTVLFAVDGYRYGGRDFDRREVVDAIEAALPSVRRTVTVAHLRRGRAADTDGAGSGAARPGGPARVAWAEVVRGTVALTCTAVPFEHPLWVLYSSGTTGLPKPIVQSQGGILLEHLKVLALHHDIRPDDRFFWFSTTGWMMWNLLLGGLTLGATIVLYDGSAAHPTSDRLWRLAEETGTTVLGTSAAQILASMKAGVRPGADHDLSRVRAIGSTGSPLPPEGFRWVYEMVKPDVWLASVSGGTDVCTGFAVGCPLLPVRAGVIQCRALGAAVAAYDDVGHPLVDAVGELVVERPMPSMPTGFWNDPGGRRYRAAYFEMYPGVWRHGDWVRILADGGVIISGRSDATINRLGVRMGTSELYRVVEELPEVQDSLVVDLDDRAGAAFMPLFVVPAPGCAVDDALRERIRRLLRRELSPRHVPDAIIAVAAIPRTLSGKKLEVPVKRLLQGEPVEAAVSRDAIQDPRALEPFLAYAAERRRAAAAGADAVAGGG